MISMSETASLLLNPSNGGGLAHTLGVIPMCLEPFMMPTTKTTVINDPTAGMTPEEITNYLSNVGGGLCGYPDSVRTLIGLSLNLSLLALGVLALSYGTSHVSFRYIHILIKTKPSYNIVNELTSIFLQRWLVRYRLC